MENDVKSTIRKFIQKVTRKQEILDDEDIFQGGIVNSLLTVQLIMFIEKNFQISIDNNDINLENFRTMNKIEQYIQSKKGL